MERRAFLASAGIVALSGCSSSNRSQREENHTNEGDDSPFTVNGVPREDIRKADEFEVDPPGEGMPTLDASAHDVESPLEVEFVVGIVNSYSREEPARVQIDLVNASAEERQIKFGAVPPFSSLWTESSPGESDMYIVPSDRSRVEIIYPDQLESDDTVEGVEPIDGCWMIDDVLRQAILRDGVIQPGHVVSGMYDIFTDSATDICIERGAYRFSDTLVIENLEDPLELAFTITVNG